MSYRNDLLQKIEKYKAFFSDETPGQILTYIYRFDLKQEYSKNSGIKKTFKDWDFEKENRAYIEYIVGNLREYLDFSRHLNDDYIPCLTPGLGIALYSAYFSGADIIFGEATSWAHPVLESLDELDKLSMDPGNKWFRYITETNSMLMEFNEGDYITQTFSHLSPLDMANAIRGNDIFYDFYDEPEKVHLLLDKCKDAIIWLEREQWKITDTGLGGTGIWGTWIPGHNIFMSQDVADMCSPEIFSEFGDKHTQDVIDAFNGCYIHHHAKGLHVNDRIARLRNLKVLEISLDPNEPRPIDRIGDLYEQAGGKPIMLRCISRDVYEKIDEIKQGKVVLMLSVDNIEEGEEVLKFIRKHSRI